MMNAAMPMQPMMSMPMPMQPMMSMPMPGMMPMPMGMPPPAWWQPPPTPGPTGAVKTIEDSERELLVAALTTHRGRIPAVARALGVSRGTVYNKMRKFNLDPDSFR
jgi:transcriptional regulator of acetoin/glycerol metabolism